MKEIDGYTKTAFIAYLNDTLIPDLCDSDMVATANDFLTSISFMQQDDKMVHFRIPDADEVQYVITSKPCDRFPSESLDDHKMIVDIMRDMENGNEWAWVTVGVHAKWKCMQGERNWIGECSYRSEGDYRDSGYFKDQCAWAYETLVAKLNELSEQLCVCNQ